MVVYKMMKNKAMRRQWRLFRLCKVLHARGGVFDRSWFLTRGVAMVSAGGKYAIVGRSDERRESHAHPLFLSRLCAGHVLQQGPLEDEASLLVLLLLLVCDELCTDGE